MWINYLAITGLVYSFPWVSRALYRVASGGKAQPEWIAVASDTTATDFIPTDVALDRIWQRLKPEGPAWEVYLNLPRKPEDAYFIRITPNGRLYSQEIYYYDQYSLREVRGGGVYSRTRYATADLADMGETERKAKIFSIKGKTDLLTSC